MSILILVLPFWILGILSGWYASSLLDVNPFQIFLLWVVILLLNVIFHGRKKRALSSWPLLLALLIFTTSFQVTYNKSGRDTIETGMPVMIAGIIEKVWYRQNSKRIKLKAINWKGNNHIENSDEKVLLMISKDQKDLPEHGEEIIIWTRLEYITKKEAPNDFPEQMYWAGEGVRKKGWMSRYETIDKKAKNGSGLLVRASRVQEKLCFRIDNSNIGTEQASVIKAMLLGRKDDLPTGVNDIFRQTGISHLLAVSGLHVGLIYLIIIRLFFFLKSRRTKFIIEIIAVLAVWFYSFMTGFGPSVQRAAGMISFFAISRLLGRRVQPMQILGLSFLFQTAINPFALFSFGFQLSYLAVAGIFIAYRPWTKLLTTSNNLIKKVWAFAGVSVSAQTFTLPFILMYFHEFPIYFLLGNLLLVPIGLIVFYFGVIYIVFLSFGLSLNIPGQIMDYIIRLMISLGELIANLPLSMLNFESFSIMHLTFYYVTASVLLMMKGISSYKKLVYILICALCLGVIGTISAI